MLILVCGMHRSGSTLVWQIARQLLDGQPGLRNPRGVESSEFPHAAADPDDLLLAKVHYRENARESDYPQDGAKYLYTYRDLRDVVASLYRKGRFKEDSPKRGARNSTLIARRELRGDAFWRTRDNVWVGRYEDITSDIPALVCDIAAFLGVPVTSERVDEIATQVGVDQQMERVWESRASGVDPDLRVTANHITDGRQGAWRDTLTEEEAAAINKVGARWLVEHGYDSADSSTPTPGNSAKRPPQPGNARRRPPAGQRASNRPARPTPEPPASGVPSATMPLLAAGALACVALVSRRRNPGAAALLWMATAACTASAAYRMGRDGETPRDALAPVLARLRRR